MLLRHETNNHNRLLDQPSSSIYHTLQVVEHLFGPKQSQLSLSCHQKLRLWFLYKNHPQPEIIIRQVVKWNDNVQAMKRWRTIKQQQNTGSKLICFDLTNLPSFLALVLNGLFLHPLD